MARRRFTIALVTSALVAMAVSAVGTAQTATAVGNHDRFEGASVNARCAAEGWASDPTQPTVDITVRVLVDGAVTATGLADRFRQDLADAGIGADGTAAFDIELSGLVSSGVDHEIRVQAQDLATGEWIDLGETPRHLTCARLFGFHDLVDGVVDKRDCVASGWAFDADTPSTRVQVRVRVNGKVVAESSASMFRPDVLAAGFGDGFSGWTIDLFGKLVPGSDTVVTVEARDTTNKRLWLPLEGTNKHVTCLP